MLITSLRRLRRRRGQFSLGGLCSCCAPPVPSHTCAGFTIPDALTLTDATGTIAFNYSAPDSGTFPTWIGTYQVNKSSDALQGTCINCGPAAPTMGPMTICYSMSCIAGSSPHFVVSRNWAYVQRFNGSIFLNEYFQDCTYCGVTYVGGCGATFFGCATGGGVGTNNDSSVFHANPSGTTPFTLSGTPTGASFTTDPIGGSVTISG